MNGIRDEMRKGGVECDEHLIIDGNLHRFRVPGSRKANGWYVLRRDGDKVFGAYGDWKTGLSNTIGNATPEIRRQITRRNDKADVRAELAAQRAAAECGDALDADATHPYLRSKQVEALGIYINARNQLMIPMYRSDKLVGIQYIMVDGSKLFMPGSKTRGAWLHRGHGGTIVLCEGYATGASIHMATNLPVLIAFNCGNLLPAAQDYAHTAPRIRWIIAADNDHKTPGNPGLTKAEDAASALRAPIAVPFGAGTDFNDMHIERGLESVASVIYACL